MLALLYCTALETSHSLMLSPRLMRDLWPTCEQACHLTADLPMPVSVAAVLQMHAAALLQLSPFCVGVGCCFAMKADAV